MARTQYGIHVLDVDGAGPPNPKLDNVVEPASATDTMVGRSLRNLAPEPGALHGSSSAAGSLGTVQGVRAPMIREANSTSLNALGAVEERAPAADQTLITAFRPESTMVGVSIAAAEEKAPAEPPPSVHINDDWLDDIHDYLADSAGSARTRGLPPRSRDELEADAETQLPVQTPTPAADADAANEETGFGILRRRRRHPTGATPSVSLRANAPAAATPGPAPASGTGSATSPQDPVRREKHLAFAETLAGISLDELPIDDVPPRATAPASLKGQPDQTRPPSSAAETTVERVGGGEQELDLLVDISSPGLSAPDPDALPPATNGEAPRNELAERLRAPRIQPADLDGVDAALGIGSADVGERDPLMDSAGFRKTSAPLPRTSTSTAVQVASRSPAPALAGGPAREGGLQADATNANDSPERRQPEGDPGDLFEAARDQRLAGARERKRRDDTRRNAMNAVAAVLGIAIVVLLAVTLFGGRRAEPSAPNTETPSTETPSAETP